MRGAWSRTATVAVVLLLAGCGSPVDVAQEVGTGPHRMHWQLTHRVPESAGVLVVGRSIDAFSESTWVSFGAGRDAPEVLCSVSVYAPGQGGPDNKIGEKVPTTVQGRPAVRNGAGAEGDYLTWQRADGAWVETLCGEDDERAYQDRLAEIVTASPSDLLLPFTVPVLPAGLGVTSIDQDLRSGETTVRLAGVAAELVLTYDGQDTGGQGRTTVIAGYPATVKESTKFPGLCLEVQAHRVCVDTDSSDTGPYPDRSAELPVMIAVAESLRFPADLDDRSSWHPAQDVFG